MNSPMTPVPDCVAASSATSAAAAPSLPSSSNVPASILGFLRCALGPNVSPKGSVSTIWDRCEGRKSQGQGLSAVETSFTLRVFGLRSSSRSAIGSLLRRRRTEYGSFFLEDKLVRK